MTGLKFSVDEKVKTPDGLGTIAWYSPILRKYAIVVDNQMVNYTEWELLKERILPEQYDKTIVCGNCGEPLTFAHGVGACLEGCGELHGYDQESDLWTPAILEDRRK